MRLKISGGVLAVLIVAMLGAQTASAAQKPLHLLTGSGPLAQPLALEEVVTFVPSGDYTLETPGGYLQCPSQITGGTPILEDEELLASETGTSDVFNFESETLRGTNPCSTSTGLGEGNLGVDIEELVLNGNGRVEAPFLQTFASFAGGTTCEYRATRAKGRMAIGSAPVPLSITFSGPRMKLQAHSSPICPRTAALYATFVADDAEPVFASN
jgi:hypothetical protein